MYIIRFKTGNQTKTYTFTAKWQLDRAAAVAKKTNAAWFSAIVSNEIAAAGMRGRILEQYDAQWGGSMSYVVQSGPYRDYVWATIGSQEECERKAAEVNAKITCWADVSAKAERVAGSMWQVICTDPFKD